jgi:predicted ATPase
LISVARATLCKLQRMRLLERGEQTAQLARVLQQAGTGRGRVVLVSGAAGMGKTSLVRTFARVAADHEATVRIGACDDLHAPPSRPSAMSRPGRAGWDARCRATPTAPRCSTRSSTSSTIPYVRWC